MIGTVAQRAEELLQHVQAMRPDSPSVGELVKGYYDFSRIGSGAFGTVIQCRSFTTGKKYAMKTLRLLNQNVLQNEVAALSRLADCPYIPELHEVIVGLKHSHIVLELLEGGDLRTYVNRTGPLPEAVARRFVGQLACAIHATHAAGLMHRGTS